MVKKPLIAAVALAALAGCATAVPTTHSTSIPSRSVATVAPHLTQAQIADMRAKLPQRLTPQQAKAELVKIPAGKIKQDGRSVKYWGSFGYYPYSYLGYSYYWPYSYYGGYYYPYSYYPYSFYGGSYWPYSYWW